MAIDGRSVLLIDEDEESVLLARRKMRGVAVCGYANSVRLMSEGNVRENVLINGDGFELAGIGVAFQITLFKGIFRIFVLSSEDALPPEITGYPFMVNGRLVFFSNGGEYGDLLFEKRNQGNESCDLCEGSGEVAIGNEHDVCPKCGVLNPKEGKDWCLYFRHLSEFKPPMVVSVAYPSLR